jgi:hypothetical protein
MPIGNNFHIVESYQYGSPGASIFGRIPNANQNSATNFSNLLNMIFNRRPMQDYPIVLKPEDFNNLIELKFEDITNKTTDDPRFVKIKEITNDCSICMDPYEPTTMVKLLPCGHYFHTMCIDKWLKECDFKCPICRAPCGESKALLNNENENGNNNDVDNEL